MSCMSNLVGDCCCARLGGIPAALAIFHMCISPMETNLNVIISTLTSSIDIRAGQYENESTSYLYLL